MVEELPLERCYKIILACVAVLEKACVTPNGTICKEAVPEWGSLFGEKESAVSVLGKLVAMQKNVLDLMERAREQDIAEDAQASISEEDWQVLALCVDRWRTRNADTASAASGDRACLGQTTCPPA